MDGLLSASQKVCDWPVSRSLVVSHSNSVGIDASLDALGTERFGDAHQHQEVRGPPHPRRRQDDRRGNAERGAGQCRGAGGVLGREFPDPEVGEPTLRGTFDDEEVIGPVRGERRTDREAYR